MPATQETPQLTIYRNGPANLNGEATRTLSAKDAETLLLLPPPAPNRAGCYYPQQKG